MMPLTAQSNNHLSSGEKHSSGLYKEVNSIPVNTDNTKILIQDMQNI